MLRVRGLEYSRSKYVYQDSTPVRLSISQTLPILMYIRIAKFLCSLSYTFHSILHIHSRVALPVLLSPLSLLVTSSAYCFHSDLDNLDLYRRDIKDIMRDFISS